MIFPKNATLAAAIILFLVAISTSENVFAQPEETKSPAAAGSGEPNLTLGADGHLYLSWIETDDKDVATLLFSKWDGERWEPSKKIATGNDWFVNWADFPSLCALSDGTLAAHWLKKSGDATFSYDVQISLSRNHGKTWSEPLTPHGDGTKTEHGFVSLVPLTDSSFGVFWLDGRSMEKDSGDMSLRFTTLDRDGRQGPEILVDDRVCECCQTSAVVLAGGEPFVVYRDRSLNETRDISAATLDRNSLVRSKTVNADGWVIEGCPVNGPATYRIGSTVVVAWPTVNNERPEVRIRFSTDSGKTFGKTYQVDEGDSLGRVDVVLLDSSTAVVSWLSTGNKKPEIRLRVVHRDGQMEDSQMVAKTQAKRASGFPQIEYFEGSLFFAWTDASESGQVRTALLPIKP